MRHLNKYYFLALLFILPLFFLQSTGCQKEYSFEGGDTTGLTGNPPGPSGAPVAGAFPVCKACDAAKELAPGEWSFKTGNSFLCGVTTNSGFFGGYSKEDVTLFGPSACSVDTGLVLSIYNLEVPLDQDRLNLTSAEIAFYYYDHNSANDIFTSRHDQPFTVTISSYVHATGITTGKFSGTVFRANGSSVLISDGKFKIIVK